MEKNAEEFHPWKKRCMFVNGYQVDPLLAGSRDSGPHFGSFSKDPVAPNVDCYYGQYHPKHHYPWISVDTK